jgi:hypothetical protein
MTTFPSCSVPSTKTVLILKSTLWLVFMQKLVIPRKRGNSCCGPCIRSAWTSPMSRSGMVLDESRKTTACSRRTFSLSAVGRTEDADVPSSTCNLAAYEKRCFNQQFPGRQRGSNRSLGFDTKGSTASDDPTIVVLSFSPPESRPDQCLRRGSFGLPGCRQHRVPRRRAKLSLLLCPNLRPTCPLRCRYWCASSSRNCADGNSAFRSDWQTCSQQQGAGKSHRLA